MKKGLIHLYTGDGKGKTTAAIGLSVRAIGAQFKVLFVQFMKGQDTAELKPLHTLGVEIYRRGEIKKFIPAMTDDEKNNYKQEQSACLEYAQNNAEQFNFIVLDEVISAITTGMITQEALVKFITEKPLELELVLTGRDAPQSISNLADYISCIKAIKHPYENGIMARRGIEF